MPDAIDFYFDFISPYGYLGSLGIEPLAARHGRTVRWRPMLLGISVLKVMGLKPLPDTPLKGDYLRRDVPRFFVLRDVPYRPADGALSPLVPARAFTWLDLDDPALAKRFAQAVYRAQWSEGQNMSTLEALAPVCDELGIDVQALGRAIGEEPVKAELRRRVEASLAIGVFGAPTFVIDGEPFWGADRLDHVERWLAGGGWLAPAAKQGG